MEKYFARRLESLTEISAFLADCTTSLDLGGAASFSVNMAVEELFTNMVKYNGQGDGDILVGVDRETDGVRVELVDSDSEPFDITANGDVDITADLKDRTPGGLGLHLVRQFMDEISYDYRNGRTQIRLFKRIAGDPA